MLLDLLKTRYSCRNFSEKPIPSGIISYILECGRLSPSGGNEQPWKFGVITDKKLICQLAQAASVNYRQDWIGRSPLVIALCTQVLASENGEIAMRRFPTFHDDLQKLDKKLLTAMSMEEHQTKIPGEHMVLAALEHGIYSTWISSVDCEKVAELLNVQNYLVTNLIAFGYPATAGKSVRKKKLDDIVFTNRFENHGFRSDNAVEEGIKESSDES